MKNIKSRLIFAILAIMTANCLGMRRAPNHSSNFFHITEQTEEDKSLREKMRDLFFEKDQEEDGTEEQRKALSKKVTEQYEAKKLSLTTEDSKKISAFYFKRPEPKVNIIYVDGYYPDGKEWCCPFAILHPEDNILTFDWREFGESEKKSGSHVILEAEAYSKDIQAAIDFIRQDNDKPIILYGICFGAAMVIYTTLKAQQQEKPTADALGFNSIWKNFDDIFSSGMKNSAPFIFGLLYRLDCLNLFKRICNFKTRGKSLFSTLKPIEMIENINLPCWFDHYTFDTSTSIDDAIELYEKVKNTKVFFQSNVGKHGLVHSHVPFQYKQAFDSFLKNAKLIS